MASIQCSIRIRGGAIINSDASKENPNGKEYPVLHAEVLDNTGKTIQGGVLQIPLTMENRGVLANITDTGTLTITVP